jgi:TonB family protein
MRDPAPQPAAFSLLPTQRAPWIEFVFSSGAQACAVAFLLWLRLLQPVVMAPTEHVFGSIKLVSTPVPENHQPQPSLPVPVNTAYAVAQISPLRLAAPQPRITRVEDTLPTMKIAPKSLETGPLNSPATPKIVALNMFSGGSSAAPTIVEPAERVQTGGFGDPNSVPAKEKRSQAVNIAAVGSFDLPSGAGYGNGTGRAGGARGVVPNAGFGNGPAAGNGSRPAARTVEASGFGDADVVARPTTKNDSQISSATLLPAEIISKPTPSYTAEARSLKIQGEVLLEVVLAASGNLYVLRVIRGLGHGLDDNAVKAAKQIRFRPALRDGQPADSKVLLHIVFQLA